MSSSELTILQPPPKLEETWLSRLVDALNKEEMSATHFREDGTNVIISPADATSLLNYYRHQKRRTR